MEKITMTLRKWVVILALTMLGGCDMLPYGYTSIKEIAEAPASFEGKQVKIKGKVKSVTMVSLLGLKMYTLDDGSGEVLVIPAENEKMPAENNKVVVSGRVQSMALIGGKSMGLHIQEAKLLPTLLN